MATVSIILPVYNRLRFLPSAFESIRSQTYQNWELIVVDDGSTDGTREAVARLTSGWSRPVRYLYQDNRGAYAARNTGIEHAKGNYIAFFDSDDYWLRHHLKSCVVGLESAPEVDRLSGACRVVRHADGSTIIPSTFYEGRRPRPFLRLRSRSVGPLRIIDDVDAVRCAILGGVNCGLQSAVFRRRVFEKGRFRTDFHNEAEDALFMIRLLASGGKVAFLDQVHVHYNVHYSHSSAVGFGGATSIAKHIGIIEGLIRGFETLPEDIRLSKREACALKKRLGQEYFWNLGYCLCQQGRMIDGLLLLRRGIELDPLNLWYRKTFARMQARLLMSRLLTSAETPA